MEQRYSVEFKVVTNEGVEVFEMKANNLSCDEKDKLFDAMIDALVKDK